MSFKSFKILKSSLLFPLGITIGLNCVSTSLQARSKAPYSVRINLGSVSGNYSDKTRSDAKDTEGETEAFDVSGTLVNLGIRFGRYEFEVESKSVAPTDASKAYMDSRGDFYFHFMAFFDFFPYVGPSVGYYSLSQTGSTKEGIDDPFSFLDQNNALVFGGNTFLPWEISKAHQLFLAGKYIYLTTLEASRNFGNERQISLGYAYNYDGTPIGIRFNSTEQFYFAQRKEENTDDQFSSVRSESVFQSVSLHFRF